MFSPVEAPLAAAAGRLPSLSAFFPAHNEEENLVPMAAALLSVLPAVADEWELVVVDDGSEDATGRLADELAAAHPRVRVVHHRTNRGYGAAVRSGLAAARYDYVFFTDGDHQFDVRQIVRLIPALDRADAVVGYRAHRSDPALRRLNAAGWNLLVRRLLGLPVRDVNCAFKLLRREALAGIILEAEGAMVSAELLARLQARGVRMVEVAVDHFPRRHGMSSGARPRVIVRAFVELARLYRRLRAGG
ncbi:MAG: glycosyltransferase family 2 protein [Deltaproteobacteria bacterium]|nr:MAG: glycosyltransferase family 2 protein [Deltaproteobacteria bacterium]